MLRVRELRNYAQNLARDAFVKQLGPFTLVQRPDDPVMAQVSMQLGAGRTVGMASRQRLVDDIFTMVQGFDGLVVYPLPPLKAAEELRIGRVEDCDLVIDDPSVSKQHAVLKWDASQGGCSLVDLGSSNGTFVNAKELGRQEERLLFDGDVVSFGDAKFMYFDTGSLHAQLQTVGLAKK